MFLQQTAAGGLCALFLLLLQRIFRNLLSPRWQYGIWGVLVLRLMIPVGARGRSTVLDVWPWLEAARGIREEHGLEWMEEHTPAARLLLEMEEGGNLFSAD